MPYRDLPADFGERYKSAYIDPLRPDAAAAPTVGQHYTAGLNALMHAAKAARHAACTNQHHQTAYGFMANPRLMGALLARQPRDVPIIQLGSTLPSTSPPT